MSKQQKRKRSVRLFTRVGLLLNHGDFTLPMGLEFPQPLTEQGMFDYLGNTFTGDFEVPGYVAFTDNDGVAICYMHDSDTDEQRELIAAELRRNFLPESTI